MEILIEKIVHGGDAMGRAPDGRPVFVPFAAPGERIRVEPEESRKGFFRARLLEVIEPSPDRITPRCRHFGECGGCQFQHLTYASQVRVKEAILREQLIRLGGIPEAPIRPVIVSPNEWNYRNHVQGTPVGNRLGYFRAGSQKVLPIEECHLPEPRLWELWNNLEWEPDPGLRQIGFRAGDDDEMIVFEGEAGKIPEVIVESDVSAAWLDTQGETFYLAGGPLRYEILGRVFMVSAGSFFQVNTAPDPGDGEDGDGTGRSGAGRNRAGYLLRDGVVQRVPGRARGARDRDRRISVRGGGFRGQSGLVRYGRTVRRIRRSGARGDHGPAGARGGRSAAQRIERAGDARAPARRRPDGS